MDEKIMENQSYYAHIKTRPVFKHFQRLTTKIGIMQHAKLSKPDRRFGYCIDDNARALIVAVLAFQKYGQKDFLKLAKIYLDFIDRMQKKDGNFHNFLSYNLKFQDEIGSEDSFGRTIWALGLMIFAALDKKLTRKAANIFKKAEPNILKLKHLRAKAFSIIGLTKIYQKTKSQKIYQKIEKLAHDLYSSYLVNSSTKWQWFEPVLTYSNGILPQSLLSSYQILKNKKYLKVAKKTLDFLNSVCFYKGKPAPIGQKGWYKKEKKRALFDQQPLNAASQILVLCTAFQVLRQKKYLKNALDWFFWFWGNNLLKKEMIDSKTGGVYDGLKPTKRNKNQGAESILSYLLAFLTLQEFLKNNV